MLEEDPTTDGSGARENTVPTEDPQMEARERGTEVEREEEDTKMINVDGPA